MFALALLIVALIVLIINVALCPTIEKRDYKRLMDEETERETVNTILQAYLDGLEKGLSLSRQADYDLFDDIDNKNEKDGEGE